jgi:hypothetical protein
VLTVSVRVPPLPAKTTLLVGTSAELEVAALSLSVAAAFSTSPTVRLIVPEWSSLPHVPAAATVTVGGRCRQ